MDNLGKIGVGITTYESQDYFNDLYDTLPFNKIDEIVVVNGGKPYSQKGVYDVNWIQHNKNYYPAYCRNDAIQFLLNRGCDHIFLIEDDMLISDVSIFERYIKASKLSGIKYFSYVSTAHGSGIAHKRTPRLTLEYSSDVSISLYHHMCNEFTYHHRSCFDKVGIYDTQFRDPFDVDMAYRESKTDYCPPFWWFPDITGSDDLIKNNPEAVSRLQSKDRDDGGRDSLIEEQFRKFYDKHGMVIQRIPNESKQNVIEKLKRIKKEKS